MLKASKEERLSRLEADYGMKRTYELESKVDGMCDYSIGIAKKNYMQGEAQGKNELVEVVQRLRRGESREEIIKSGIDEHTVDLAMTIK